MSINYKDSGVDVERGYQAVEQMKKHVVSTHNKNVLGGIGSFGGFYSIEDFNFKKPVLVSGTDGVGTKLKYAFALNKFDTVGIDCVAMCVNDIVCQGAKPLLFLDYIATGKIDPSAVEQIVKGIADGCKETGTALIGGETAEMPGFYQNNEFDLAGFSTGIVDRDSIINGANIKEGDILVGLASSGLHSNGYSLVRKLFPPDDLKLMSSKIDGADKSLGEILLTPTKLYVKTILSLMETMVLKGVAHITGGGFIENIPRIFPSGLGAKINLNSYELPAIFKLILEKSKISTNDAYNTFNMGIGMVIAVDKKDAEKLVKEAEKLGEKAYILGEVIKGEGVTLV